MFTLTGFHRISARHILAVSSVVCLFAATGPVQAHDEGWHGDHGRHLGWENREWRGHRQFYGEPRYFYGEPRPVVVYEEPPVVYLRRPPPPVIYNGWPSINVVIPVR